MSEYLQKVNRGSSDGGGAEYMMYRVAICEDEVSTCEILKEKIKRIFKKMSMQVTVDVFYSGEAIITFFKSKAVYNFIFLDIELYELNGVDVARYIREDLMDVMCQIVFVSSKTMYALELFQFQPLDFLVKPVENDRLERVIKKGIALIGLNHDSFDCVNGTKLIRTQMSKILYFESEGRKIRLVTSEGEITFYDRLSKILNRLPAAFIRTHKSYIVNLNAVRQCRYDSVVLYDKREIPISRSYRETVRDQLMKKMSG